jgi:hypothetical protein
MCDTTTWHTAARHGNAPITTQGNAKAKCTRCRTEEFGGRLLGGDPICALAYEYISTVAWEWSKQRAPVVA